MLTDSSISAKREDGKPSPFGGGGGVSGLKQLLTSLASRSYTFPDLSADGQVGKGSLVWMKGPVKATLLHDL